MSGGDDANNGGRVTTRELYNAQQEQTQALFNAIHQQNRERADMERRIISKMDIVCDSVSRHDERIKKNEKEVEKLRTRSNVNDIAVGVAAAVSSAIAAVFGMRN